MTKEGEVFVYNPAASLLRIWESGVQNVVRESELDRSE